MKKSEIKKAVLLDIVALTSNDDAVVSFEYTADVKEFMQAVGDIWLNSHSPKQKEMLNRAAEIVMDALRAA